MQELEGMTRAQLLTRCQTRGLKATGWKKERMLLELRKLEGRDGPATLPAPATGEPAGLPGPEDEAGDQEAAMRPESPVSVSIRSGWCISNQHADGRPMRWGNPCPIETCPCWCHLPPDPQNLADHRVVPKEPVQRDVL